MKVVWLGVALLAALPALISCDGQRDGGEVVKARGKNVVFCTTYPLYYFVDRIAGGLVDAESAAPDKDLRHWTPDRNTLQLFQAADRLFLNGADLEAWRGRVSLKRSSLVDVSEGLGEHIIRIKGATHTHGGDTHTHDGADPFLWLNPRLAALQAEAVAKSLEELLPEHRATLRRNLEALKKDLSGIGRMLTKVTVPDTVVVATESYYNYLARGYVGAVVNLDLSGADTVTDEQLAAAHKKIAGKDVRVVLCPKAPGAVLKVRLEKSFSARVVVFDPCFALDFDRQQKGKDFVTIMTANVKRME